MPRLRRLCASGLLTTLATTSLWLSAGAALAALALDEPPEDLPIREEKAVQAAVERVAPSVVRIETLGGLETVGGLLVGTGPTTGLVISADGYIISSAFNFAQKPTQILVYLPDGARVPARLVSTDHNRKLALLKVETDKELSHPEAAPLKEMAVGQTAIAVGRTYGDGSRVNLSAGILSATNRIWNRALQTDAKVSPSNYGGPLVDLRGRVMGVLVPLALDAPGGPAESGDIAGVEYYDSGIGFAIPLAQILELLPRMKQASELHPGKLGVNIKGTDLYSGDVVIAAVPPGSPAYQAGLKAGDTIVELDGVKIARQADLRHHIVPRYAGDKVKLVAMRGSDRIEREIELVAKLEPYQHPFLGILPMRDADAESGVVVRFVYPDSPAAQAGLQAGDRVVSLDGAAVEDRNGLLDQVAADTVGQQITLEIRRGDQNKKLTLKLASLPEAMPPELPNARGDWPPAEGEKPATGLVTIKIPEAPNTALACVPETYQSNVPHGVVLWLHAPGGFKDEELVATWKEHCERHDLIVLAPKSQDASKWQRSELEFIRKALDDLISKYNVDRKRIIVAGQEGGGSMAFLFAIANREVAQGVIAVNAPLPRATIPANEPVHRQAFLFATAKKAPMLKQVDAMTKLLRAGKYPVTQRELGEIPEPLTSEQLGQLVRWIDALDRI